jgi:hypothetical protein
MRTQAGLIMGSPAYMSPEQCKDSADVDLRSDIYSFATIIYETLAGRTPYVAATGTEMLVMHLTGTPAPLHELVDGLPAHVEAAIMRALSRAREDRFDSIAAFVGALRADAGGDATAFGRSSPSEDLPTFGVSPVTGGARTVAVQAITTLSRATGEAGPAESEDVRLTAVRNRRWPLFALGAGAAAGLAIFLWVRSPDSVTGATPGTLRVAAADAAIAGSVVTARPDAGALAVPGRADGGAATHSATGGRVGTTKVHRQHDGNPRPPSNNKSVENSWIVH